MVIASVGSLVTLVAYLFVFRWSERFLADAGDYVVATTVVLLGATMISVQSTRLLWQAFGLFVHFALSTAVFGYWRLLCQPTSSHPIW